MVLIVQPTGGLCNRMRVLDSAIAYAEETKQSLYVIWLMNSELNCTLDQLFTHLTAHPLNVIQVHQNNKAASVARGLLKIPFLLSGRYLHDGEEALRLLNNGMNFENIFKRHFKKRKHIYLCTCWRFHSNLSPFMSLKPVNSIQDIVNSYTKDFNYVVGVHVRRTDHKGAIENSPLSSFVELMKDEIKARTDVKFFLATDSSEVENQLRNTFPNKIITHTKSSLNRAVSSAIKDAMVDLYCLSRTKKIIGSHASSFSETAATLGQIEMVIARKSSTK